MHDGSDGHPGFAESVDETIAGNEQFTERHVIELWNEPPGLGEVRKATARLDEALNDGGRVMWGITRDVGSDRVDILQRGWGPGYSVSHLLSRSSARA